MTFSFKNNIRKIGGVWKNVILVLNKDLKKAQQIEPAVLWCDSNPVCVPQLGRACCKLQQRLMLREMFLINLFLSSLMFRGIYNADK